MSKQQLQLNNIKLASLVNELLKEIPLNATYKIYVSKEEPSNDFGKDGDVYILRSENQ